MANHFIFLLLLATFTIAVNTSSKFKEFQQFTQKYNKRYKSIDEFVKKYEIFKQNKKTIQKLQPKKLSGKQKPNEARFAPNQFADLTQEEFIEKYLTLDVSSIQKMKEQQHLKGRTLQPSTTEIPKSWDWRDHGAVSSVKHQHDCGSCWAFTTAATLESQYLMKTGKEIELSVQQLIDCDKTNKGCHGGVMNKAYKYLQSNNLLLAEEYPYENDDSSSCRHDGKKGLVGVKDFAFAETQDEQEIKRLLYEKGPLGGAVNALPLAFYEGGIYDPWFDWLCSSSINHAITIVGYGEEDGTEYWIIKNSWGEEWGENGFFRIALGRGLCGINTFVLHVEAEINDEE